MKIMKKITREKGITLVALVVTIIILLILAGVAIASVTGDNGLFRKAREATNMYKDSERDEQGVLRGAENELSKLLNPSGNDGGSGGGTGYVTGNTKVDVSDGSYYIPDGFKLAEDSGKTINEGIVVEDKNGNQWVWIPCYVEGGVGADVTNAIKYDRYAFASSGMGDCSQTKLTKEVDGATVPDLDSDGSQKIGWNYDSHYFHEEQNSTDEASIREFGGYYIGRYEAGDGTVTNLNTPILRKNSDQITNTVTIKKGQAPYNYVTQDDCVTLSNNFGVANNYDTSKMYTKLCSSYAWDTALMFIDGDYATNSTQGNYWNTTFSYKDITGANQTKGVIGEYEGALVPTGQTTAVKKIYDMGGNLWEYTSESFSIINEYSPFVVRGGYYCNHASKYAAACRYCSDGYAYVRNAFRPTLFLSNS